MGQEGYFLVHRKIQDCWIWTSDEPFDRRSAWIDLIMMANHKDVKLLFDGNLITVERGQRITSIRSLAERWKWGKAKVTEFLRLLENDGMIKKDSDKRRTLLTIVNYEVYQVSADSVGTVSGHSQGQCTDGHRPQTNNENNDNKKESSCLTTTTKEKVVSEWNSLPKPVPKITKITNDSSRGVMLRKRIADYGEDKVIEAINNIRSSDFLQGGGNKGFIVSFDWFIRPDNFQKVLENNYMNQPRRPPDGKNGNEGGNNAFLDIAMGRVP